MSGIPPKNNFVTKTPNENDEFINFDGKIHLILSDENLKAVAEELRSVRELGFDTETRPSFKSGDVFKVALLQLATDDNAYLIRLHHLRDFRLFAEIFENNEVLKVGVAIRDDIKQLQKLFPFAPQNFVELQDLAKAKGLKNFGLRGMADEIMGARLSKRAKTSNWEAQTLTEQQIKYAATDAWIGLELFRRISVRTAQT